jgi:DNA-binding CsgD family transcriptional regulator
MSRRPSIDAQPRAAPYPDNVMLNLLAQTLGDERSLQLALFAFNSETGTYSISTAVGFPASALEKGRRVLVFRVGDDRGIVGLVAEHREPRYVRDCLAEPRWIGRDGTVRSSYLVPLVLGDSVPRVLCVASPHVDGLSVELRALIDCLVDFAARAYAFEVDLRARLERLEHQMRDVAIGWTGIRDKLAVDVPAGVGDRLKMLSPREWEVIERLRVGQRITTVAHALNISANTVRNHVKSISRKLGVRSQDELREYIGSLRVGADVKQRNMA